MTSTSEQPLAPAPQPDIEEYNAYVQGLTLVAIETVQFRGERLGSGPSPRTNYQVASSFATDAENHFYRYDATARILSETDEIVAIVEASAVVVMRGSGEHLSPATVAQFSSTSGAMMATPFLRESVNALATRLGYLGVFLPAQILQPNASALTAPDSTPSPKSVTTGRS